MNSAVKHVWAKLGEWETNSPLQKSQVNERSTEELVPSR